VAAGRGASIVLVTIDTLRADRLGAYGSARSLTPAMDSLAAEGIRFDAAIAQVPLTLPSHATMLTGAHPARHGVRTNDGFRLEPSVPTLAEALKSRGFATAAFIGGFPLHAGTGLARGFGVYDDAFLEEPAADVGRPKVERPAGEVVQSALTWIEAQKTGQPFFAWLHLFDPHTPYEPPPGLAGIPPYDGEVRATDAAVGRLIDRLTAIGQLERVIFVLTADHGESLGEHGERTHGTFLYDATIRVPLIVRLPAARGAGMAIAVPVETADIAPTLAAFAGASLPAPTDGRSLLPLIDGDPGDPDRATYAESYYQNVLLGWAPLRAVRTNRWKYVEAPRPELYDLRRDPPETRNLIDERENLAAGLAAALPPRSAPGAAPSPGASPGVADAETAERLRSLGYVSGRTVGADESGVDPKDRVEVWSHLEEGIDRLNRDPAGAARALSAALQLEPRNGLALKYLGDLSYRARRDREALTRYREAIEAGFVHPDVFVNLSAVARRLGDAAEARKALEAAAGLDRESTDIWNELGILRAASGDEGLAREAFSRAIALDPGRAEPHYNLALVLRRGGNEQAAMASLRDAVSRNPSYAEAHFEIGNGLLAARRPADALASYRAALGSRPQYPEALFGAARAAETLGRADDARTYYERFIAAAPTEYPQHLALARAALRRLGPRR
jgi:arylsulfatase A-like enzyme/tetratricopeptide (TPR) repeat protein